MNHLKWKRWAQWIGALLAIVALPSACTPVRSAPPARVFFVAPPDKASVSSPVPVSLGVENFTVEPAGAVREGAGHLHILVDTPCLASGEVIPQDEKHLHYGNGQMAADLELSAGEHTLCLQAANGAHVALAGAGMTHTIQITVE